MNTAQSLAQQVASKQIKPPVPVTNMSEQTLGAPASGPIPTNTGPFQDRKTFEPGAPPAGFNQAPAGVAAGVTNMQDRFKSQQEAATEAAAADKALKIEQAKRAGKAAAEEKAKVNTQEEAEGRDINGDGLIGYDQKLGGGRPMTEQEVINTQLRKLIEGGASPEEIEKERSAMKGELAASEARDIQSTRARTGLGGMGLTGAAGAMESQVRQEGARKQALTMADFERQQRSESAQRALEGIQGRRQEDVYQMEMELARREAGPLRSDYPTGVEGDTQFEQAKKDDEIKKLEDLSEEEFNSQVNPNSNSEKIIELGYKKTGPHYNKDGKEYYKYTSPAGINRRQYTGKSKNKPAARRNVGRTGR